jgi:hypothetical protein
LLVIFCLILALGLFRALRSRIIQVDFSGGEGTPWILTSQRDSRPIRFWAMVGIQCWLMLANLWVLVGSLRHTYHLFLE